jgi:cation diffusion facilitator family transporter
MCSIESCSKRCGAHDRIGIDLPPERTDPHPVMNPASSEERTTQMQADRMRAGRRALFVGILIFVAKFGAYALTGSTAVFADAMESTINIVSAGILVLALSIAARPPDSSHPYGHGKVEFVSAGIEGAAIGFAALVILVQSIRELLEGPELQRLDLGLALLGASAIANAALGFHLTRVGRRTRSDALVADGRHVLADVWTSVGVIGGLIIVVLTGWMWADPLIAIAVAINVAFEGYRLLHHALGGLMDEADGSLIESTTTILEQARKAPWIDLHGLRSWRSGARRHFDLHLTVPRYFDVGQVHAIHDRVEAALLGEDEHGGDVVVHFDPCDESECHHCAMSDCPIRSHAFAHSHPFTPDRAVLPDSALQAEPYEVRSPGARASRPD